MQFVITAYDGVGLLARRMNVVLLDREFVQKV